MARSKVPHTMDVSSWPNHLQNGMMSVVFNVKQWPYRLMMIDAWNFFGIPAININININSHWGWFLFLMVLFHHEKCGKKTLRN